MNNICLSDRIFAAACSRTMLRPCIGVGLALLVFVASIAWISIFQPSDWCLQQNTLLGANSTQLQLTPQQQPDVWTTFVSRVLAGPDVKAWQCSSSKLAVLNFSTVPEQWVAPLGPRGPLQVFASTEKGQCNLLPLGCLKEPTRSQGIVEAPWLEDVINAAFRHCHTNPPCHALDIGSNLGIITLLMLHAGGNVVSVEPQLDMCCASHATALWHGHGSRHLQLCGWLMVQPGLKELAVPAGAQFFRYGSHYYDESGAVAVSLFNVTRSFLAKGLPLSWPVHTLGNILVLKPFGRYTMIKIDTDSADCNILQYLVQLWQAGILEMDHVTLEMSGFCADETQRSAMNKLFAEMQAGFHLYRADANPAQQNGYAANFDLFPNVTEKVVELAHARMLKFNRTLACISLLLDT